MKRMSMMFGAAIALATATSAMAAPFTVTYIGTVSTEYDTNFLGNGQSVTGDAFSETFVVDPATPGAVTYDQAGYNYTYGGTDYYADTTDPVTSLTFTVAGKSVTAPADAFAEYDFGEDVQDNVQGAAGTNQVYDYQYAQDAAGNYLVGSTDIFNYTDNIVPATYGGNGSYTVQAGDYVYGSLEAYDSSTGLYSQLALNPTEVIFSSGAPGAVPEPGTWALMLTGLGLIGGVVRRRAIVPGLAYA